MLGGMQTRECYEDTGTRKGLMSHIFIASLTSNQAYQDSV